MNVSIRIDVTDNFLPALDTRPYIRSARHLTQNDSVTLVSGSPKLMETNREGARTRQSTSLSARNPRAFSRSHRPRLAVSAGIGALITANDIYYDALRNYPINTRSFESGKNCSLRDARVTVDAIKITLLAYIYTCAHSCPGAPTLGSARSRYVRTLFFYYYIYTHVYTSHARVIAVPFVRTEVDRLNCEFHDNYASSG